MRAVIQRVSRASVSVDDKICGQIDAGLLVLAGVQAADTTHDVHWMADKITKLRCFDDVSGKMNLSLLDTGGSILLVSQFTVFGDLKKGTRPSFNKAAPPTEAIPLYEELKQRLSDILNRPIPTGVFGAAMRLSVEQSGPVTLIMDSRC
ncbi:MAG: D-tyrosyl-tRNA(Tyr) deacylase [Verrucomicrobia bacterium]|nr:D-tyrosyl-tRNA(Tyr) deacylase [Verrucomicrobiota bacterium]